jgi:hypothetical protein
MTVLDCVNRIKLFSHRGNQAITTDQITTDILNCLNEAWSDLVRMIPREVFRADGPDLSTVIGQEIYSLTGYTYPIQEFIQWHYIFQGVNYNLKRIESEREFWGQVYFKTAAQNRPFIYVHWGYDNSGNKQIRLFPIPDQIYTLNNSYQIDATTIDFKTLTLTSTVPFFPGYMQQVLWKGGLAYFLKAYDDPMAAQRMQEYEMAKIEQDIAQDKFLDSDLQWRFDSNRTRFVDPVTGIRLQ